MLIDQRCVLTLRRLSPPTGDSAGTDDAADGTIDDDGADGATHGPG